MSERRYTIFLYAGAGCSQNFLRVALLGSNVHGVSSSLFAPRVSSDLF